MGWGKCKNVVMGDGCGYQNLESSWNDPLLCGCCDCHKHLSQKMIFMILDHAKRNMMGSIVATKVT
jgi:hypothetical protein